MAEKGTNVLDYLRWRGDLDFTADSFNEVDNLILCIICYLNFQRFPSLKTKDAAKAVPIRRLNSRMTEKDEQLGLSNLSYLPVMRMAAESRRFGALRLFGYESDHDDAREMQFDAISFLVPDGSIFVSYMGTDRSLAGWKEDFNMSYLTVPAQERAAAYALEMAQACPERPLRIGGHSKGGNLAAWAAIHLPREVQENRLLAAYNNDGPGFRRTLLETPEYERIKDKLHTYIPEASIVGILLEHEEDYAVIASSNKAMLQHEAMSWSVMGNRFVHLGERSQLGKFSDEVLQEWIGSMSIEEREEFSEALFEILGQGGKVRSLEELTDEGFAGHRALLQYYTKADEEKKKIIGDVLRRLAVDIRDELRRGAEEGIQAAKDSLKAAVENIVEKRK